MSNNQLKQALKEGDIDILLDEMAESYVNSSDVYVAQAQESNGLVTEEALKERDRVKFKNSYTKDLFTHLRKAIHLLNDPKWNKTHHDRLSVIITKLKSERFIKQFQNDNVEVDSILKDKSLYQIFEITDDELGILDDLGEHLIESNRVNDALDLYYLLVLLNDKNASFWSRLGYCYFSFHEYNDAVNCFWHAHSLAPNHPMPLVYMVQSFLCLNDLNETKRLLKELRKRWDTLEAYWKERVTELNNHYKTLVKEE